MTIPVYAAGRTESSAPTKQNKNRAKRDVEDAVPYEAASTDIRMDGVRSPSPDNSLKPRGTKVTYA